jgi:hypothetical protein
MRKISAREVDIEALRSWRFQPPGLRVHVRREALYRRRQQVAKGESLRLCGIANAGCHRALNAYGTGGLEQLQDGEPRPPGLRR